MKPQEVCQTHEYLAHIASWVRQLNSCSWTPQHLFHTYKPLSLLAKLSHFSSSPISWSRKGHRMTQKRKANKTWLLCAMTHQQVGDEVKHWRTWKPQVQHRAPLKYRLLLSCAKSAGMNHRVRIHDFTRFQELVNSPNVCLVCPSMFSEEPSTSASSGGSVSPAVGGAVGAGCLLLLLLIVFFLRKSQRKRRSSSGEPIHKNNPQKTSKNSKTALMFSCHHYYSRPDADQSFLLLW